MVSTACSTTGADKKLSAPVAVNDSIEIVEDTICYQEDTAQTAARHDTLVVAMTGDIMLGTTYPTTRLPENEGRNLFRDVKGILQKADIALGNLEGTFCDSFETTKKKGAYNYAFRTPVRLAQRLKEAGFDFMSMANNHAFDFGLPGVISTENALNTLGIMFAGIKGRTAATVIKRNGVSYGVCAFGHNGYTLRHQDLNKVRQILDSLNKRADVVIVSFHGGAEGKDKSHLPYGKEEFLKEDRGSLRDFAHFCIDNGADIVFGHGPHVVRCVEVYNSRMIAYSLGNFCTPYGINITGISGYAPVLEVKIDRKGRLISGKIHSFIQCYGTGPRLDKTDTAARQMRILSQEDITVRRFTMTDEGEIKPL